MKQSILKKNNCKVLIYDLHSQPLLVHVDVDIFEQGGYQNLGFGQTGQLLGEVTYGVSISWLLNVPSIAVVITDEAMKYAPITYSNLNGSVESRLDLTLYELPDEPGDFGDSGGGPRIERDGGLKRMKKVQRQIQDQKRWSFTEKKGVENLISTYVGFFLPRLDDRQNDRFQIIAKRCEQAVINAGISPESLFEKTLVPQVMLAH